MRKKIGRIREMAVGASGRITEPALYVTVFVNHDLKEDNYSDFYAFKRNYFKTVTAIVVKNTK